MKYFGIFDERRVCNIELNGRNSILIRILEANGGRNFLLKILAIIAQYWN